MGTEDRGQRTEDGGAAEKPLNVTVDMDKACKVCGAMGVIEKTGACFSCTGKALAELKRLRAEGRPVGRYEMSPDGTARAPVTVGEVVTDDGPGPKLKRIAALRVLEVKDPGWLHGMRASMVPELHDEAAEGKKALAGWCGRHPLDPEVAVRGNEVNAGLCVLKREPPGSLVKATVEKEVLAYRRANGVRAGKAVRSEIKARVSAVLAEGAQWVLRENRVVARLDLEAGDLIFTDATGDNQLDAVCYELSRAGLKVQPLSPEGMMLTMGGLATADWSSPKWLGERGTAGAEFLTWAVWRVIASAVTVGFGANTPFLTGKSGSKEEVTAGGDASADELLRRSLQGGRRMIRMRLIAGNTELGMDAGGRICGLKWTREEPETAYQAAAKAWGNLEEVFEEYAHARADPELWAAASAAIGEWIAGSDPEEG